MTVADLNRDRIAALGLTDQHAKDSAQVFVEDLYGADLEAKRSAARELLKLTGSYPSRSAAPEAPPPPPLNINLALFAQPSAPQAHPVQRIDAQVSVDAEGMTKA